MGACSGGTVQGGDAGDYLFYSLLVELFISGHLPLSAVGWGLPSPCSISHSSLHWLSLWGSMVQLHRQQTASPLTSCPLLWVLAPPALCSLIPLLNSCILFLVCLLAVWMTPGHSSPCPPGPLRALSGLCRVIGASPSWGADPRGCPAALSAVHHAAVCPRTGTAGRRSPGNFGLWPHSPLFFLAPSKHRPAHGCQEVSRGAKARWNFSELFSPSLPNPRGGVGLVLWDEVRVPLWQGCDAAWLSVWAALCCQPRYRAELSFQECDSVFFWTLPWLLICCQPLLRGCVWWHNLLSLGLPSVSLWLCLQRVTSRGQCCLTAWRISLLQMHTVLRSLQKKKKWGTKNGRIGLAKHCSPLLWLKA